MAISRGQKTSQTGHGFLQKWKNFEEVTLPKKSRFKKIQGKETVGQKKKSQKKKKNKKYAKNLLGVLTQRHLNKGKICESNTKKRRPTATEKVRKKKNQTQQLKERVAQPNLSLKNQGDESRKTKKNKKKKKRLQILGQS